MGLQTFLKLVLGVFIRRKDITTMRLEYLLKEELKLVLKKGLDKGKWTQWTCWKGLDPCLHCSHRLHILLSTPGYTRKLGNVVLLFSHQVVSDSYSTLWIVAPQAPLSMGFLPSYLLPSTNEEKKAKGSPEQSRAIRQESNEDSKNTEAGCIGFHFLLQRIFPTQGSNLRLLH